MNRSANRVAPAGRAGALSAFHLAFVRAGARAFTWSLAGAGVPACAAAAANAQDRLNRPPEDDVVYFVLPDRFENADPANDRGGVAGGRLDHGFDPTDRGFYTGGDLRGLTDRLDYIEGLGVTAIWLAPIYRNKPVQGPPGDESAGYHGYWITDFTTVDPHFGTEADFKAFVDAAHARGIKVILDIVTNHSADIIKYRECHDAAAADRNWETQGCAYRPLADYPYATRGGPRGEAINPGFMGDAAEFQTTDNFDKLVDPGFAYTPFIPAGDEDVKRPAWLNDMRYYHNRGDSEWRGESSLYGDFAGLDDLFTAHPRVVEGFIDIYKDWITRYGIDGFRIDTVKHVNPEFWRAFSPAILSHAADLGIAQFYMFGEVYDSDPGALARFTRVDRLPAVLDFAFQAAVREVVADGAPAIRLAKVFAGDVLYEGGEARARRLPVFIGNHDMGRFAMFVREANPDASDAELVDRVALGHAMMFFLRGVPVIYYGDEQGFNGDEGDKASRETMFAGKVADFNDNDLIGTDATTGAANFDRRHPLYRAIADMSRLYRRHEPLRRGRQIVRMAENDGGIIAVSRLGETGGEYLVVFNAENRTREAQIAVDPRSSSWRSVYGRCAQRSDAPGSVSVSVPALGHVICRSNEWASGEWEAGERGAGE